MSSRRHVLTLAVSFLSLACPGLAMAQGAPATEQPTPSSPPAQAPATAAPAAPAPEAPPAVAQPASPEAPPAVAQPAPAVGTPATGTPAPTAEQAVPAEETAAAPGQTKFGEEIVVTGSRIRRKDLTTPAPVTVLSREQVVASGKVSIGDFLQALPEQGNAINTSVNNGGDGSTRVSLRSLGSARTLVLMNGRRIVAGGTGADASVDLNSIPTAAIERIEVLKDGASAVYGSDAIGGVVNIITRRKFSGTEVSAYAGTSGHGDGQTYDVNATTGTSSERSSILFSAGYFNQKAVMAGDRDFSKLPVGFDATGQNTPFGTVGEYSIGSGRVPAGTISLPSSQAGVQNGNALWNQLVSENPTTTKFIHDPDAPLGWRPYVPFALPPKGDAYNFQPDNYLVTPAQRISLFSTGDVRIVEGARAYFEASYVNRQSEQDLAPEPLIIGPLGADITLSKDSIYNPFGRDFTLVERRLVEFGRRKQSQDIDTYRVVGGFDGTLPEAAGPLAGWFWDVSGNFGRTVGTHLLRGNLRTPTLANAVGPSFIDSTGAPRCGTPGNVVANCVPLNLFGGPGTITPDQVAGLTFQGTQRGMNQLAAIQANTSGPLFTLLGDRPVSLAVGYEYRNVQGEQIPDPVTAAGETSGNQARATSGGYHANEGYGELSIPVVSHLPFAESVEATAAARIFNYSNFGSDWTYKFGGRWTIIPDVTVRGTYSTAFRAPSVNDLFLGTFDTNPNAQDPCRLPAGQAPANCVTQGVAGNGDQAKQLRETEGGNPSLQPETAKIYTVGLVLEPRYVKGLTVTLDYYKVAIENSISFIGTPTILAGCYPSSGAAPKFCNLIHRDPISNQITNIDDTNQNVGKEDVSGIDIAVRYILPTRDYGRFGFVFDGTWLKEHNLTQADGTVITGRGNFDLNQLGTFGVNPAWKFNAGVSWGLKNFGAGVITRFIGSFKECGDPNGDFSGSGLCYQDNTFQRKVDAWSSWDAFVSYNLASVAGRTNVGVGVNNVFDAKPAVIYNGFTAASDPSAYDFMGRFFYVRLTHTL